MKRSLFYSGVACICGCVTMLQIVETRLLSVVSHYYLAFLSISMAMFGMTVGAVWVYTRRSRATHESLPDDLALFAAGFALSIVASLLFQVSHAPVQVSSATIIVIWAELAVILATPFFFAGATVSLALTRSQFPIGDVYAADLAGAALGCLGVLVLLNLLDAPSCLLAIAAIAAVAAGVFARARAEAKHEQRSGNSARIIRWSLPVALILFGAALLNASTVHGLQPALVKDQVDDRTSIDYEKWNSYSRIQVRSAWTSAPWLWAASDTMPPDIRVRQRLAQHRRRCGDDHVRVCRRA